jgi:shikimate dehydrogenase
MTNKLFKYGLIGEKLGHSFSKTIHQKLGLYDYTLFELNEKQFEFFMNERKFEGINITIPYKEKVLQYCDVLDESVQAIQAANTIVKDGDQLVAYNTDYEGLKFSLAYEGIDLKDKIVLILGTGGTSKTIQFLCKNLNAKEVLVVSRTPSQNTLSYPEAYQRNDIDIIINATPVGMYPNLTEVPINLEYFTHCRALVDVIYNPLKSQLLLDAETRHMKTSNGLLMLIAQAVFAAEKFSRQSIDPTIIHSLYQNLLKENTNIVLIGMPSSGKSSLGKRLGQSMHRKWLDVDQLIEESTHQKITDIFSFEGEAVFRNLEKETIQSISKERGIIISTGGGSILDPENIIALKQNGVIFYLERDLDHLMIEDHRPLAKNKEALKDLYYKRQPLYLNSADVVIKNNENIEQALVLIQEKFNEMFSD